MLTPHYTVRSFYLDLGVEEPTSVLHEMEPGILAVDFVAEDLAEDLAVELAEEIAEELAEQLAEEIAVELAEELAEELAADSLVVGKHVVGSLAVDPVVDSLAVGNLAGGSRAEGSLVGGNLAQGRLVRSEVVVEELVRTMAALRHAVCLGRSGVMLEKFETSLSSGGTKSLRQYTAQSPQSSILQAPPTPNSGRLEHTHHQALLLYSQCRSLH